MKYRWLKYVLSSFIFAVLLEIISGLNYEGFILNVRSDFDRRVYSTDKLEYNNAEAGEHGQIISSFDPQIIINDINDYVYSVEVKLNSLASNGLPVQVYYDRGEGLEECTTSYYLENQKSLIIEIDSNVSVLRLDIGTDSYDVYNLDEIVVNPSAADYFLSAVLNISWVRIAVYIPIILLVFLFLEDSGNTISFLFSYRWYIGAALIAYATILKLHGSSIGCLVNTIEGYDVSRIFGTPRPIRSDEYLIFTEMALSQVRSGFKWFSDIWGYSPSDMYIIYGQPVRNLVTLFRPFSVGYIIGGAEYGLAFYWSARLVVLFLISFEFARIFTDDDRMLSLIYAILVSFSPLVQWWFSINELVEMLIFGQLATVILYLYLHEDKLSRKIVYVLGIVLCCDGYILAFYPPWMVPFFYVFLVCGINVIIDNYRDFKLCRSDIFLIPVSIIAITIPLVYILGKSGDTIETVMGTVYPGQRVYYGGPIDNLMKLFMCYTSYLWTFIENENPCETVDFINFFPVGIILSIAVLRKKKDNWLISMNILNAFLVLYLIMKLPSFIGTITFLNRSTARIASAVGFLNLIILLRSIKQVVYKKFISVMIMTGSLFGTALGFYVCNEYLTPAIRTVVVCVSILFAISIIFYINSYRRKMFLIGVVLISIIGGGFVNPINTGLDSIYHSKLVKIINEIEEENSGPWIASGSYGISGIPAVIGADTISAVALYPDKQLWEDIGLEGKEDVWNRYAHLDIRISDKNDAEVVRELLLIVHLTTDKLKELGVKYIFSMEDLSQYKDDLECLYSDGTFSIYRVL